MSFRWSPPSANREEWWKERDGEEGRQEGRRRRGGAVVVFSHVDYSTTDARSPLYAPKAPGILDCVIVCAAHCWPICTSSVVTSSSISKNKCFTPLFERDDKKSMSSKVLTVLHFDFYHRRFSLLSSGPGCICLYFDANQSPDVRES